MDVKADGGTSSGIPLAEGLPCRRTIYRFTRFDQPDVSVAEASAGTLKKHPCISCGACCAYFRVSFYWREAEATDHQPTVPSAHIAQDDGVSAMRTMKGTDSKHHPRCSALEGRVGSQVRCRIYEARPTACRAFEASFESGRSNPRCDEARIAAGLKPLSSAEWTNRLEIGLKDFQGAP